MAAGERVKANRVTPMDGALAEMVFASFDGLPDAIVVADMHELDAPLIWVGGQFTTITGYGIDEALGKNCRYLQGSDRLQPDLERLRDAVRSGTGVTVTLRNYRKNGTPFWNELTLVPHRSEDGALRYYVGIMRDVTAARESVNKAFRSARIDDLTGLPNRDSFLEDLAGLAPADDSRLMMIKLDIAGLHGINSTYGYAAGDEVIRKTANRLQSLDVQARSRIGNNEFAVAVFVPPNCSEDAILASIASVMRPPFAISDAIVGSRYALGYVLGEPGQPAAILAQQAGYALHESKADPTRTPHRFDHKAERKSMLRSRTTAELQGAIRDDDFIYHYQPQFDLRTRRMVGVEALIRWHHPIFGLQPPASFVGVAEETGQIIEIERAGIRQVAALARDINATRPDPLMFSINISPLEVTRGNLPGLIREIVDDMGVDPAWLTLELTESLLTESSDSVVGLFQELRALGIGLSIDDFGTGYSSLRSIERFPISEIKIDRTFVENMLGSGTKRIVIDTIIALGAELGVRVVAEGIETQEQQDQLVRLGCLIGQGYLFSRPLSAEAFRASLHPLNPPADAPPTHPRRPGRT